MGRVSASGCGPSRQRPAQVVHGLSSCTAVAGPRRMAGVESGWTESPTIKFRPGFRDWPELERVQKRPIAKARPWPLGLERRLAATPNIVPCVAFWRRRSSPFQPGPMKLAKPAIPGRFFALAWRPGVAGFACAKTSGLHYAAEWLVGVWAHRFPKTQRRALGLAVGPPPARLEVGRCGAP